MNHNGKYITNWIAYSWFSDEVIERCEVIMRNAAVKRLNCGVAWRLWIKLAPTGLQTQYQQNDRCDGVADPRGDRPIIVWFASEWTPLHPMRIYVTWPSLSAWWRHRRIAATVGGCPVRIRASVIVPLWNYHYPNVAPRIDLRMAPVDICPSSDMPSWEELDARAKESIISGVFDGHRTTTAVNIFLQATYCDMAYLTYWWIYACSDASSVSGNKYA